MNKDKNYKLNELDKARKIIARQFRIIKKLKKLVREDEQELLELYHLYLSKQQMQED